MLLLLLLLSALSRPGMLQVTSCQPSNKLLLMHGWCLLLLLLLHQHMPGSSVSERHSSSSCPGYWCHGWRIAAPFLQRHSNANQVHSLVAHLQ
jgi:hypothetical protein